MPNWMFWMPSGSSVDDMLLFAIVLWVVHQVVSVGTGFFFNTMHAKDILSHLRFANGKAPPVKLYREAWKEWILSHLFFLPFFMAFVLYPLFVLSGGLMTTPWPSVFEVFWHIIVCMLANETIFYFSHRFLHRKKMFRLIHRKHHMFRQVRAVCSEYAHPVENAANLVAMYSGLVLLGSHFVTWAIWVGYRIYETCDGHSGYSHFDSSSRHAFHHRFPSKGCLGTSLGLWDRILGTDKHWREWKAKQKQKEAMVGK